MNLTFARNIEEWENGNGYGVNFVKTFARVYLFENFSSSLVKEGEPFYPDYYISCNDWTGSSDLDVFFIKINETILFRGFWTGTNWSETVEQAKPIGFISNKSIIATIPTDAFNLSENVTIFALSVVWDHEWDSPIESYIDVAPEELTFIVVDSVNTKAPENDMIRIIILSSVIIGLISFLGLVPIIILHKMLF